MNSKDFWNSDYWLEDVIFILSRIKERCLELYFKGGVVVLIFFFGIEIVSDTLSDKDLN